MTHLAAGVDLDGLGADRALLDADAAFVAATAPQPLVDARPPHANGEPVDELHAPARADLHAGQLVAHHAGREVGVDGRGAAQLVVGTGRQADALGRAGVGERAAEAGIEELALWLRAGRAQRRALAADRQRQTPLNGVGQRAQNARQPGGEELSPTAGRARVGGIIRHWVSVRPWRPASAPARGACGSAARRPPGPAQAGRAQAGQ
ncbi:MAG: hypothetical protein U1A27_14800 [Phycisphaerae bacterium]